MSGRVIVAGSGGRGTILNPTDEKACREHKEKKRERRPPSIHLKSLPLRFAGPCTYPFKKKALLPAELHRQTSSAPTTLGPVARNGEAFRLRGRLKVGGAARHLGRQNDAAFWNQGSEMCVSVLYRPSRGVSRAAGWLAKNSYWRFRSEW